jgi:hypothetical protein
MGVGGAESERAPWHFLYFNPEPQGHGEFRETLISLKSHRVTNSRQSMALHIKLL